MDNTRTQYIDNKRQYKDDIWTIHGHGKYYDKENTWTIHGHNILTTQGQYKDNI